MYFGFVLVTVGVSIKIWTSMFWNLSHTETKE